MKLNLILLYGLHPTNIVMLHIFIQEYRQIEKFHVPVQSHLSGIKKDEVSRFLFTNDLNQSKIICIGQNL